MNCHTSLSLSLRDVPPDSFSVNPLIVFKGQHKCQSFQNFPLPRSSSSHNFCFTQQSLLLPCWPLPFCSHRKSWVTSEFEAHSCHEALSSEGLPEYSMNHPSIPRPSEKEQILVQVIKLELSLGNRTPVLSPYIPLSQLQKNSY